MKIKKIIAIFTALIIFCGVISNNNELVPELINIIEISAAKSNFEFDESTGTIIKYNGSDSIVNIPEKIDGITVKRIYGSAFLQNTTLSEITIPNTVTSIGSYAFYGCKKLISITIPDFVSDIGNHAFYECIGLTEMSIPDSVTSIGNYTFYGCKNLTDCIMPDSITCIGAAAFEGCTGLTSITIPDSITSIGASAFEGCKGLTSITIPDSVASIEDNTFCHCKNLTDISIPNSVTYIGDYAFFECTGLTSITIPDSVTSIGASAFAGCKGLTSIAIPNSVTYIGDDAFTCCENLSNLTISNAETCVGAFAFEYTSWARDFPSDYIVANGILLDYKGQDDKVIIPKTVHNIADNICRYYDFITNVTIPNSVTSIGANAFSNCERLTSITIPDSVTSIGRYTFWNTLWMSTFPSDFVVVNGILLKYKGQDDKVIIPDYVKRINDSAFEKNNNIKEVLIPDSVTSIGECAFTECEKLTSVTMSNSVTSIGASAFEGCKGLTSITIPDSVMNIEDCTFYKCENLLSVTMSNSVTSIGASAFEECTGLTSITIPDSITSIGAAAFEGCKGLTSITIPDFVSDIGNHAFYDCDSLTEITIPDSVTSVAMYVFGGCDSLTKITIPNSVTSIGECAFLNCENLTSITIPYSVKEIGNSAFSGCKNLSNITIPKSVKKIGDYAFSKCENLNSVIFGGTPSSLGVYIFKDTNSYYSPIVLSLPEKWQGAKYKDSKTSWYSGYFSNIVEDPKIVAVKNSIVYHNSTMNNYYSELKRTAKKDYYGIRNTSSDGKETYLKLMEDDIAKSKSNKLLTFTFFNPTQEQKNAMEDTYEVLYEYLKKSIEVANQKGIIDLEIDNSKELPEIEAKMINKIYASVKKSCTNPDVGTGKHGYTVDLNVYGGIFNLGFGKVTISKGDKTYTAVYCSDKDVVAKAMNLYMNDLCNEVKKEYKDAFFSMWNYFLDKTLIKEISTEILKGKIEDYTDALISLGYGNVLRDITVLRNSYDDISGLLSKKDYSSFSESLKSMKSNGDSLKSLHQKIKNSSITDKELKDTAVKNALDRVETSRENLESALFDYIYDVSDSKTSLLDRFVAKISCPVDVEVINTVTGDVVGYVKDGVAYSDGSIEVDCSYDMKTISMPVDEKYNLVLTGTDEGSMQIMYEYIEDGEGKSFVTFYDVPLSEGIVYTQELETNEMSEDVNEFAKLVSDDGTIIDADEFYTSDDENNSISVTVEETEGGICYGDGIYYKGDSVLLTAIPYDEYQFIGWYENDVLISCQSSFRFPAIEDRNINMLFEKIRTENTDYRLIENELYKYNSSFWVYNTEDDNVDIDISIFENTAKSTEISAEVKYLDGETKEVTLKLIDDINYQMNKVDWSNLDSITFSDSDANEIAILQKNTEPHAESIYGDVNNDGSVTSLDLFILIRYILMESETINKVNTDINKDGEINLSDCIELKKLLICE